ncbi:MAG: DUF1810 domain-containing protein [Rhodospirillales bacterium]|nr:DUF1810 domain-containing protein [Rhodospirillales bacterium]MBO6785381.1 DUF1810 domain-containing protein [Rhodospirillales bacterium]
MANPYQLEKFVLAQRKVWPRVVAELTAGQKRSHWMWFVFPQIAGLGLSVTSQIYAIPHIRAARAYLKHAVLGSRLEDTTRLVLGHNDMSAEAIFGGIDAMKFRSSMTLFEAADGPPVLGEALDTFFGSERDEETLKRL